MPSGYTAPIAAGITFEQFVWGCARAFGALVTMRDDPSDAPIPDRLEPEPYYAEKIAKVEAELYDIERMDPARAVVLAREEYDRAMASDRKRATERAELERKYRDMLDRVEAWKPPSPDHVGMRDFMLDQLRESIRFDCSHDYQEPKPPLEGRAYIAARAEKLRSDLDYYRKQHAEEVERIEKRNEWLRLLRESVPMPSKTGGAGR